MAKNSNRGIPQMSLKNVGTHVVHAQDASNPDDTLSGKFVAGGSTLGFRSGSRPVERVPVGAVPHSNGMPFEIK